MTTEITTDAVAQTPNGLAPAASIPEFNWSPLFPRRMAPRSSPVTNDTKESIGSHDIPLDEEIFYNYDASVWLRSCSSEELQPIEGVTTGSIPKWLKGCLLRNGPGSLKVGNMTFDHLFDGSALLHRFAIANGRVTYQNRFLQSQAFKRNAAAQRIVLTEFGTKAVPDPCQSIFQRVSAVFKPGDNFSDNTNISVYPFGDQYYTFTEVPVIHRIDPSTLETLDRVNVSKHVSIVNHSSHPHVMADGTVYNLGLTITATGPSYAIVKFPPAKSDASGVTTSMFDQATIQGTIPARWPLHPAYMHTFGFTDNYFVIVEQPLSVSVPGMMKNPLINTPIAASFRWYPEEQTQINLLCRKTGKTAHQYLTDAFCYFHIINCFEKDDHVVVDICCYRDPSLIECMYVEALKASQKDPEFARMLRSRPLRFLLPLGGNTEGPPESNPERLLVTPELLCSLGCEAPRVHWERHAGRPYRFFYAISADVDLDNQGMLIKVDTLTRSAKTWCEANVYPSEPIFVPSPNPTAEDDGVVLSALVWGSGNENKVALLVLNATTWMELGRTEFSTLGPVPRCFHGWFAND